MSERWTVEPMASARAYRLIRRDGKVVAMDVEPRAAVSLAAAANLVDDMAKLSTASLGAHEVVAQRLIELARRAKALDAPREYPEGRER